MVTGRRVAEFAHAPAPPIHGDLEDRLASVLWYHTIDVRPGLATSGWWDLRHALPLIPFPDVRGKRCLDVGTWDGFFAFELERRGAAEVVALDVPDLGALDYPAAVRAAPAFDPVRDQQQERPVGFRLLQAALGSKVQWRGLSIYDLTPEATGSFDVVFIGSLLVHLRDPVRALEAVRSVTSGALVSSEYVHTPTNLISLAMRHRPLFELRGVGADFQWWLASDAGLRQLLSVAGFQIEAVSRPFLLRPGPTYASSRSLAPSALARDAAHWLLAGDATPGAHLHRAYRARPLF